MNRRQLMLMFGGVTVAWSLPARAQQQKMPVIGILGLGSPDNPAIALNLAGFREGLKETGFAEEQNVAVEYRWAYDDEQRLPALAAELVARNVDVVVTEGGILSALSAKRATSTIPIIFHASDAIADGVVSNLARPDGNLTGISLFAPEALAKEFQLLSELVPAAKIIALLAIPNTPALDRIKPAIEEAARARGVQYQVLNAATDSEIDAAFAGLDQLRGAAVVRANGNFAEKLVTLAARHRVPVVYNQRAFATAGGLLSYGVSLPAGKS